MNFHNILGEIEKADPEVYDRLDTRRSAMKNFAGLAESLHWQHYPWHLVRCLKKHMPVQKVPMKP